MYVGKPLFAQIMDFLPWKTFHRIVARHGGDHRVRTLSCAEHFRILAFAQLTYRESLRDIEPILIVAIGIMVLILALGVFLPMWDLAKAARGGG